MRRVGLSAGLAAAILCAASSFAAAQQQQYGQQPPQQPVNTYVTWGNNVPGSQSIDVTYFVGSPTLNANQANILRQAAAAWNNVPSTIRLVEWTPALGPTPEVVFQIAPIATFVSAARPTTGVQPTTFPNGSPWVQINGQVVVTANSVLMPFTWDGAGPLPPGFAWDFDNFALQMVGYALGLGPAVAGPGSVMSPVILPGPGLTGPTSSDAAALQAVYGTPEPATFALFGVGLAALGFTRKFRRR